MQDQLSWGLTADEAAFFRRISKQKKEEGRPPVLWGWKRDKVVDGVRHPESRTVYFSADLGLREDRLLIKRAYFFLETRAKEEDIVLLQHQVGKSRELDGFALRVRSWSDALHRGYRRLRLEIGSPTPYDRTTISRRLRGKPRLRINPPKLISQTRNYDLAHLSPFAVYCGSGLSAESGLPFLGKIHEVFAVDDQKRGELIFGNADPLPGKLVRNVAKTFRDFCGFTVAAIRARPSDSHQTLETLYQQGIITQVFTDNVDDILLKVGLPSTQTRLSIFPDRFPATFDRRSSSLFVIGVSVDRREVVKQARKKGLAIIAINPVLGVAPHSRNMDYLTRGDRFFRGEAREVLPKIIQESGFLK
jgi:NAD-dependent SIR2 family protein deacetylase